jgi:hypothetical protein
LEWQDWETGLVICGTLVKAHSVGRGTRSPQRTN